MIEKIKARNFKGLTFEQPLQQYNLFHGPNGSGKSARSQALTLVLLGYVPHVGKATSATMEAFATDKELTVEATIGGKLLERTFTRAKSGSVSQRFRINQSKANKDDFARTLFSVGDPRILDLQAFLSLSDQKKQDWIFKVFPPAENVSSLNEQVEQATKKLNELREEHRSTEKTVERLQASRAQMEIPAGTLAEIRGEIEEKEKELEQARQDLEDAKVEAARQEEAEKARTSAPEPAPQSEQTAPEQRAVPSQEFIQRSQEQFEQTYRPRPGIGIASGPDPLESIEAIMRAMQDTGCSACAAYLVCKRERKKFPKQEEAEVAHG